MRTVGTGRLGGIRDLGVVTAAVLVLAAASCDGGPAPVANTETAPVRGGRLVVAVPTESNGWNPVLNQWAESGALVASSMLEPLALTDDDGRLRPWLAESWSPNTDYTEWDITVRNGVVFHDDTPFDAAALERNLDAYFQTGLTGVALEALHDHADVVGDRTVRVYLRVRWAQFPPTLTLTWMLAPSMLDRPDGGVSHPVGTGPFTFSAWTQRDSLRVKRFGRYWRRDGHGQSLPLLDEIAFRVIEDDMTRERSVRTGAVDLALSQSGAATGHARDGLDVIDDHDSQRAFIMLNTAAGALNPGNPFVDVHARLALAYATDRRRIAEVVGPGLETRHFGFYRVGSPWQPEGGDGYVDYDPARARQEIEAYRRDTGAPRLTFRLNGPSAPGDQAMLLALTRQWAEVGIDARIESHEFARLVLLAATGNYDATWLQFSSFPDPDLMFFYYASSTARPVGEVSVNFTRWWSPRTDEYLKVIRESPDHAARKAANDALIRETNRQPTTIWLYNTPVSLVARRQVRGLDGFRTHALANFQPKPWIAEAWLAP